MVGYPADVLLEQLVQLVNPDLVGGTGFPASAKVCAADVLRGQLRPRAGEERTAAVSTEEVATVRCGILFLPAVMASAALAEQFLGIGEGAGFNDGVWAFSNTNCSSPSTCSSVPLMLVRRYFFCRRVPI